MTPGLRREEVAEQAGVGTSWYTWLEQARDIRPSERTLRRIARALQLGKLETEYLLQLALEHAPRPPAQEPLPRGVLAVVNGLKMPAFVIGRFLTGDVLAYNLAANALWDFDYAEDRNYVRALFSTDLRAFIANWHDYARYMVSLLRKRSASVLGDPAVAELIDDLTRRFPEFRQWWTEQLISEVQPFRYLCNHPFVGQLEFETNCMSVLEHPGLVMVAFTMDQAATRHRLRLLIRQREHGEHDARNNLWTALESQRSVQQDHYSNYQ